MLNLVTLLTLIQSGLATAGMVPGVGILPDVVNVGIDLYRAKGLSNRSYAVRRQSHKALSKAVKIPLHTI